MDISHLLTSTITIQSQTGSGVSGDPTWGAQRAIAAALRTERRRSFGVDGEAWTPVDVLITDQPIATGDRYWPPGADTTDADQAVRLGMVQKQSTLDSSYTVYRVDL